MKSSRVNTDGGRQRPAIRIREMRAADLHDVAMLASATFSGDELFGWLYPRLDRQPSSLYRWTIIRYKQRLASSKNFCFVAETEAGTKPTIVAFAFWVLDGLEGINGERPSVHPDLPQPLLWLESQLLGLQMKYHNFLDRAVDHANLSKFMNVTYEAIETLGPHLHLAILAVDARYQRCGIGTELVHWGMARAAAARIPISLEASVLGRSLYEKLGFKVVEIKAFEEGLANGVAMVWTPSPQPDDG